MRKRTKKNALIIEDNYEDILDFYLPAFQKYVDDYEFYWLADIHRHEQATVNFWRSLFEPTPSRPLGSLHNNYRSAIYELFGNANHIIVADNGLKSQVVETDVYGLEYEPGRDLLIALRKTFTQFVENMPLHLLIVDREICRISNCFHDNKVGEQFADDPYWNGVDIVADYIKDHPDCEHIVFSNHSNQGLFDTNLHKHLRGSAESRWVHKKEKDRDAKIADVMDDGLAGTVALGYYIDHIEGVKVLPTELTGITGDRSEFRKDVFVRTVMLYYFCQTDRNVTAEALSSQLGFSYYARFSMAMKRAGVNPSDMINYRFPSKYARWLLMLHREDNGVVLPEAAESALETMLGQQ